MENYIKVIIAEAHPIFREGLKATLNVIPCIGIVETVSNGWELMTKLETMPADLVFLDLNMPIVSGRDCLPIITENYPNTKVIVITMNIGQGYVNEAISSGAGAYLLKNTSIEQLTECIKQVLAGLTYYDQRISGIGSTVYEVFKTSIGDITLSNKEQEIIRHLCKQHTSIEIATFMTLSNRTVDNYRAKIARKLKAKNTAGIIKFAVENGLV